MSYQRKADPARVIVARIMTALLPSTAILISAKSVDWNSATFTGARHEFEILVSGDDGHENAQRVIQNIGDIEFSIGGHIVADIAAICRERDAPTLFIEALSVEAD